MLMNDGSKKIRGYKKLVSYMAKNEKKIYTYLIFTAITLLMLFAFNILNLRKITAFVIFVLVGGVFKYFISRYRIFIEFTPIAFFAVIVANYIGVIGVIIYLILADVMPSYLGQYGPDQASVPHWTWVFILSVITIPFFSASNIFVLILIPIVYFLGCLFLEQFVLGGLNSAKWFSSIGCFAINFYFFIKFTGFFVGLIG